MIELKRISDGETVKFPDTLYSDDHVIVVSESTNTITIDTVDYMIDSKNYDTETYEYYSGIEAGNPSGAQNLKQIVYENKGVTTTTVVQSYDADDNLIEVIKS